jgi:DNA-binding CsgD family transcriptional regulator
MNSNAFAQNKNALHYFEATYPQVQEICKVLVYLGITHFWYDKFLSSGEYCCLGNDLTWKRHFYARDLFNQPNSLVHAIRMTPCHQEQSFMWNEDYKNPQGCSIVSEQLKFNIGHNLSIITKQKDAVETFTFASNKDNSEMNVFYMRHIDIIKDFCAFFKDKASPFIQSCDMKDMARLHENIFFPPESLSPAWGEKISAFLQNISLGSSLTHALSPRFSKREEECLLLLSTGKTAKVIARDLGLSHRTVEYYISNMKKKVGCRRETDLVRSFMEGRK